MKQHERYGCFITLPRNKVLEESFSTENIQQVMKDYADTSVQLFARQLYDFLLHTEGDDPEIKIKTLKGFMEEVLNIPEEEREINKLDERLGNAPL